jgi:hypothetical protein
MEKIMYNDLETPLLRLYRTEYNVDYVRLKKQGHNITDSDVRKILNYPVENRKKKFLGLF